jgi:hypothetical protein
LMRLQVAVPQVINCLEAQASELRGFDHGPPFSD